MDPDGGNARNVSRNAAWDWFPTWAPDGEQIAFSSERDGDCEICALDVNNEKARRLTRRAGLDIAPSWSPSGLHIAYESWDGTSQRVHTMDADGANSGPLTDGPRAGDPAWSMDGSRIAYSSHRGVHTIGANGGAPAQLVVDDGRELAWSPDGQRLAYSVFENGSRDIYIMRVDGDGLTRLTKHAGFDYEPAWSPDGREIAFTSERDGGANIFVIDVDGRDDPRAITRSGTLDGQPAWARPGASLLAAAVGVAPATWGWLRGRGSK